MSEPLSILACRLFFVCLHQLFSGVAKTFTSSPSEPDRRGYSTNELNLFSECSHCRNPILCVTSSLRPTNGKSEQLLQVPIRPAHFPVNSLNKQSQRAEQEQCKRAQLTVVVRSPLARFTLAADFVIVVLTSAHSVIIWSTCEQQDCLYSDSREEMHDGL